MLLNEDAGAKTVKGNTQTVRVGQLEVVEPQKVATDGGEERKDVVYAWVPNQPETTSTARLSYARPVSAHT